jgi:hypothetical protein
MTVAGSSLRGAQRRSNPDLWALRDMPNSLFFGKIPCSCKKIPCSGRQNSLFRAAQGISV